MKPFIVDVMVRRKDTRELESLLYHENFCGKVIQHISHPTWMYHPSANLESKYLEEYRVEFRSKRACMIFAKRHKRLRDDETGDSKRPRLLHTYGVKRGFDEYPTIYFK